MVTISTVPGRLRLHCKDLLGKKGFCRKVEDTLSGSRAVSRVEASYRTGHLLVIYDAESADLDALMDEIRRALALRRATEALLDAADFTPRPRASSPSLLGGIAREAALIGIRSIIPAPWNAFVPLASQLVLGPPQRTNS